MNNNPKVSIIIPVYNAEEYLSECIESVSKQTYGNCEIILVDDGSTDRSPVMCDEAALNDRRIMVIHKPNGGLVSAWKCGVNSSSGDYLFFLDSDDYIDEETIDMLVSKTTNNDKEIIVSDYVIERDNGRNTYCYQGAACGEYLRNRIETQIIPNILGNENRIIHHSRCMKLISCGLIKDNMHYTEDDMRFGEDSVIMLPAILDSNRIYVMDHKAFYHYRLVKSSMIHVYDPNLIDKIERMYGILHKILINKGYESLLERIDKECIFLLLLEVKNEIRGNKKGCREKLSKISGSDKYGMMIRNTEVSIEGRANRLLLSTLKNPNFINIAILKMAFAIYDRR